MKKHTLTYIFILGLFLHVSVFASSLGSPFTIYHIAAQNDSIIKANMDQYKIPGLAAALIFQDQVIYKETFGIKSIDHPGPVNATTVFRLASLSKGFSAALTGILTEKGQLNWDDKVSSILPDIHTLTPLLFDQINLTHLLSQSSGFPAYTGTDLLENDMSYEQLLGNLNSAIITNVPGTQFNYQNLVFNLISDIMKCETGKNFDQLCFENIFVPLGMENASTGLESFVSDANHALPHVRVDSMLAVTRVKPSYYRVPASAGINASLNDMINWLRAMLGHNPQVLSDNVRFQITQPRIATDKNSRYFGNWANLGKTWYGMGWRIFEYGENRLVYHGGYVEGFRAEIALLPEHDLGIIFLMNAATPYADNCVPLFLDLLQ